MPYRKNKDLHIVSCLRQNARMPTLHISRIVKLCRSTAAERVKKLERMFVTKYAALVDFSRLGYDVRLLFCITLDSCDREVFCRYMHTHPALNNFYTSTTYDYVVEMVFATQHDAKDFLSRLRTSFSIAKLRVQFLEQDLAREAFSPWWYHE